MGDTCVVLKFTNNAFAYRAAPRARQKPCGDNSSCSVSTYCTYVHLALVMHGTDYSVATHARTAYRAHRDVEGHGSRVYVA